MKILLVDDNADILELLSILISDNYRSASLSFFSNSKDAINELRRDSSYNLIISDYQMPEGNGDLLYYENLKYRIPFIFHSSSLDELQRVLKLEEGGQLAFLDKPCDVSSLLELVGKCLVDNGALSPFCRIRSIDLLNLYDQLDEIYIKLSGDHFVLVSRKELPNIELLKDYIYKKGIRDFYVSKESFSKVLSNCFSRPNVKGDSVNRVLNQISLCFTYASDLFENNEIQTYTAHISTILDSISTDKKLFLILNEFLKKGDFLVSHSMLTYVLSLKFLSRFNDRTDQNVKDFFTASMVHDSDIHTPRFSFESHVKEKSRLKSYSSFASTNGFENIPKLLEKLHVTETHFNRVERNQKIFITAHVLSTYGICHQTSNLNNFVEGEFKESFPLLYSFLKGTNY
ncbi:response regulator [Bacteriovorax sp. Seq25_V]|uniref:response regulator n=1 Tax=Bacteriovorax sp. Seq25_V TaxID=1201288 RepID=UPI00038A12CD|nr:response regulator [Bacteriovorax sp. Seq25_V]EQC46159.1 response regulator receiver domain protein [Bacteriovorax sp. Seq25_V]